MSLPHRAAPAPRNHRPLRSLSCRRSVRLQEARVSSHMEVLDEGSNARFHEAVSSTTPCQFETDYPALMGRVSAETGLKENGRGPYDDAQRYHHSPTPICCPLEHGRLSGSLAVFACVGRSYP